MNQGRKMYKKTNEIVLRERAISEVDSMRKNSFSFADYFDEEGNTILTDKGAEAVVKIREELKVLFLELLNN